MENEVREPAPKYNYISREDYLLKERSSEEKQEYFDGHIIAMSGASLKHNIIESNVTGTLFSFLKGKKCQVLPSNMRVTNPTQDAYMYPDATIVCDGPELEADTFDTLTNPAVIFELLSPSTAGMDKGRKFFFYREIPSLREYIMIDTSRRYIIAARRQNDNSWLFENIDDSHDSLTIQTIHFSLTLREIYDGTGL
ncbi:MAG: Uma2 family endonuclease [Bacteroidetes bacterium]|nr:Uma2 family endonuclease [Bacteroidota bacterium]